MNFEIDFFRITPYKLCVCLKCKINNNINYVRTYNTSKFMYINNIIFIQVFKNKLNNNTISIGMKYQMKT